MQGYMYVRIKTGEKERWGNKKGGQRPHSEVETIKLGVVTTVHNILSFPISRQVIRKEDAYPNIQEKKRGESVTIQRTYRIPHNLFTRHLPASAYKMATRPTTAAAAMVKSPPSAASRGAPLTRPPERPPAAWTAPLKKLDPHTFVTAL